MITLNIDNIFSIDNGLTHDVFHSFGERLPVYFEAFKKRNQGFYQVLDDAEMIANIESFVRSVRGQYDDVVVLGIGGSALGTKALRDGLWVGDVEPKLHIIDNVDPDFIADIEARINIDRTLFLVISKSGGTTETMTQFFYFKNRLEQNELQLKDHCVFITGQDSFLHDIGKKFHIPCFFVPENVGGRFSVLTPVGLLPAGLLGLDIRALVAGAKVMRDAFVSSDFDQNIPFQLATIQYWADQKGCSNHVLMPYSNRLKTFAEWYAQLLGESTGKRDIHGNTIGLTPLSALGATDQHSQLQLYAEGPVDKLIVFLKVERFDTHLTIPVPDDISRFDFARGVSFSTLLNTELDGTMDALTEAQRPNICLEVSEISETVFGELFFLFEGATAFLGEFFEINAFNQPGVERSKVLTKDYLIQRTVYR